MCFPTINMQKTGNNILSLRKQRGITVRELQMLLGFSTPQAIYKWQHGDCLPTIDNLVALSAIFEVTIESILITEGVA